MKGEKSMKRVIITLSILFFLSISVYSKGNTESGRNFLFKDIKNAYLYPEISYSNNPVVLNRLNKALIYNNTNFALNIDTVQNTRTDDSIGSKGGTGTVTGIDLKPVADLISFFPFKKSVVGFGANYSMDYSRNDILFSNYNAPTENKTEITENDKIETGGDLYLALKNTGSFNLGFSAGYSFMEIPKSFSWITDSSVNPALHYVDPAAYPNPIDSITHTAKASIGIEFPLLETDILLSVNYVGDFTKRSDDFIAVDTDGDGYKETLMSYKDYMSRTGEGGPPETATSYNHEDNTISTRIDIYPVIKKELGENVTFILSGKYRAVDYRVNNYKKQITTASILKDESWTKKIYDSGLTTFDALAALSFKNPKNKNEFRFGIGYSRVNEIYSQDGDSAEGNSLYSSLNTNNYTELSLGDNPENDSIVNNDVYPSNTLTQKLLLIAGYQWSLLKQVSLYINMDITGSIVTKTYDAFNLDTRTVWEESHTSSTLIWDMDPLIGIAFPIGKKVMCIINMHRLNTKGDISISDETAPYDIILGRASSNSNSDLFSDSGYSFEINLGFIITW